MTQRKRCAAVFPILALAALLFAALPGAWAQTQSQSAAGQAVEKAQEVAAQVADKTQETAAQAQEAAGQAAEAVQEAADQVAEKVEEAAAQAQQAAGQAAEAVQGAVTGAAETAAAAVATVGSDLGIGGKLGKAISETPAGTGPGQIDPSAPKGYMGIPGGQQISLMLAFIWAVWVGWVFSTVGAFGGVLAGVGHISIFGLGDYAKSFKDTSPALNKFVTDSIRVSNQWLVGLSALVSTFNYIKQKRLVVPLGIFLGLGSLFAAFLVVYTTAGKVKFSQYQGYFGLIVFVIGAFMIYEMTPKGQAKKKAGKEAVKAFEAAVKQKGDITQQGVKTTKFNMARTEFSFFGQTFGFSPIWAFVGGFFISAISSFIGVGGGFLYVPFLTSVIGLPMFIAAGTSALAVLISMVLSIFNFMIKGVTIDWVLIGVELVGIFIGSMVGPRTGKYIPEKGLKWFFIVLALYVGLRYTLRGFFGIEI